jgi:hypothetical protein
MWKPSSLEPVWGTATEAIETAETAPGWATNLPFMIAGLVLFVLSIGRMTCYD